MDRNETSDRVETDDVDRELIKAGREAVTGFWSLDNATVPPSLAGRAPWWDDPRRLRRVWPR